MGRRFADLAATDELGSVGLWDVRLAYRHSLQLEGFMSVSNIFDERDGFWLGYPGQGRRARIGMEYRF